MSPWPSALCPASLGGPLHPPLLRPLHPHCSRLSPSPHHSFPCIPGDPYHPVALALHPHCPIGLSPASLGVPIPHCSIPVGPPSPCYSIPSISVTPLLHPLYPWGSPIPHCSIPITPLLHPWGSPITTLLHHLHLHHLISSLHALSPFLNPPPPAPAPAAATVGGRE